MKKNTLRNFGEAENLPSIKERVIVIRRDMGRQGVSNLALWTEKLYAIDYSLGFSYLCTIYLNLPSVNMTFTNVQITLSTLVRK